MTAARIATVGGDDIGAVAAFQTACWQEAYRGLVPDAYLDAMDPVARARTWRRRLATGERSVAATWSAECVVGVVSWTRAPAEGEVDGDGEVDGAVDELKTLYVAASHRGTGTAARLLHTALGDRPGRLWVFTENHRAIRFYGKHGFRPTGTAQVDVGTGVDEIELAR